MLAIVWDIDPEMISLFDKISIRYYSLLFVGGLYLGFLVGKRLCLMDKFSLEQIDQLALYIFIGTVAGARIGHCLFYEPSYYLSHPLEMILPFKFVDGHFKLTGFHGLASHGGIFGVMLAIFIFCRKNKKSLLATMDKIAVAGMLTAVFIRLGNFMNSEIIGKATHSDYGIIFKKVDDVIRHPAQLYESFAYLIIFLILYFIYKTRKSYFLPGFISGLYFILLFSSRIFIELFKINQVRFEDDMSLNMGQLLSIPFILLGLYLVVTKRKKSIV